MTVKVEECDRVAIARIIREYHRSHVRQPARTNEPRQTFHQGDMEAADAILAALSHRTDAGGEYRAFRLDGEPNALTGAGMWAIDKDGQPFARMLSEGDASMIVAALSPPPDRGAALREALEGMLWAFIDAPGAATISADGLSILRTAAVRIARAAISDGRA